MLDAIAEKIDRLIPNKKIDIFGQDQLLMNTFPYYLITLLCLVSQFGVSQNMFMFIFVVYTVLPLLD
jgi:hypothetical protein